MAIVYNSAKKDLEKKEVVINGKSFYMIPIESNVLEYNKIINDILGFEKRMAAIEDDTSIEEQSSLLDEFTNLYRRFIDLLFGPESFEEIYDLLGNDIQEVGGLLKALQGEIVKSSKARQKNRVKKYLEK